MKPFLSQRPRADLPPLAPSVQNAGGFTPLPSCGHGPGDSRAAESRPVRQTTTVANPPRVECVRQGDKVVRIVVTCSCGERIEIDCLYPAGG
ncbi:MAG TPA: hypothetical protein VGD81_10140 [Opitutaceae bacterium]